MFIRHKLDEKKKKNCLNIDNQKLIYVVVKHIIFFSFFLFISYSQLSNCMDLVTEE